MSNQLPVGNENKIQTPSIQLGLTKSKAIDLTKSILTGLGKIELPSYCDISTETPTPKPQKYFDWNELNNCTNKLIISQIVSKPASSSALNGNNETKIGLSNTIGLSLFDKFNQQIQIKDLNKTIYLWVPRDPQKPVPSFIYVNAKNTTPKADNQFLTNGINITSTNASLHIELKPLSATIAYLVALKFGDNVVYNVSFKQIDKFKIFCPKDDLANSEFYSFFLNQSENKGFKGFVSIGVKELDSVEYNKYCRLKTINKNVLPDRIR